MRNPGPSGDDGNERYSNPGSPWYYPGIRVAGEWSGGLDNAGERVILLSSNRMEIASIRYDALGFWPERANGDGSSLELRDVALADLASEPSSWRSSCLYHGSPGRLVDCSKQVVINEILSHTDLDTDWIEFVNVSTGVVDLSGWYVSDNINQPLRYQIPSLAPLASGEAMYLTGIQLGFGFSELGSDAVLVDAMGTNVIRFVDTVDFPAAAREVPFGRFTRSDGATDFTELRATTQDLPNALPLIGPVVISEIMYHPNDGRAEFVELVNITDQPVLLYDAAIPSNTWELSGAVEFRFPQGLVLSSCGSLIVCATNATVFRASHGLPPEQMIIGPWNGNLDNAGETVKLRRPGDPEPDGFVPYLRVDHVTYHPDGLWPTAADGGGPSLERMPLLGYGNDPAHWVAAPSGGSAGALLAFCPVTVPITLNVQPTQAALMIPTVIDEHYIIEYTDSLSPPDWQMLQAVDGDASNMMEVMDGADGPRRYYRARWVP